MTTTHDVRTATIMLVLLAFSGCGMGGGPSPLMGNAPVSPAVIAAIPLDGFGADVAVRADGAKVYVPVQSNQVLVIDTASRQVTTRISTDSAAPAAIALTADGTRGYIGDLTAQYVVALDTVSQSMIARIPVGIIARPILTPAVAVSHDGTRAYVTNSTANADHLYFVDTATNSITKDNLLVVHPSGVAVSPDGSRVYVAGCKMVCVDGTLLVLDAKTGNVLSQIPLATAPTALVLTPDGSRAWVANGRDAAASVIDLTTQAVTTIPVGPQPMGIAIDPRGAFVYVTGFGSASISVIDTRANTVINTVAVAGQPRAIAVSPDGKLAYVTHTSRTCSVIDLQQATARPGT